jgi:hypothetical protein
MTLTEYLDATRFPITTQKGLDPSGQLLIDAYNIDRFREWAEAGELTSERQRAGWAELVVKAMHLARLAREVRAAEKGKGRKAER